MESTNSHFVSIDESTISDRSLDEEAVQNNFRLLQNQIFKLPLVSPELAEMSSIDDDDLFGNGMVSSYHDDQVVPTGGNDEIVFRNGIPQGELFKEFESGSNEPKLAKEKETVRSLRSSYKKENYRLERAGDIEDDDDDDDVFDGSISFTNNRSLDNNFIGTSSRRSKSLPDLVLSSQECKDIDEGIFLNPGSPDVIDRKKTTNDSLGELKNLTKEKPKYRRSVSFQDNPSVKSISPTTKEDNISPTTKERRKSYRKSSGYGTGDSKTSSLETTNSDGSFMSRDESNVSFSHESFNRSSDFARQDSGIKDGLRSFDKESYSCISSGTNNYNSEQDKMDLPALSIFSRNESHNSHQNQLPENEKPHSCIKSEESLNNISTQNGPNLPNFDLLTENCENEPSYISPSLRFVQKRYCKNSSSSISEISPAQNCQMGANMQCTFLNTLGGVPALSDMIRSDHELNSYHINQFVKWNEMTDAEDISKKGRHSLNLLSDTSSVSTPSFNDSGNSSNSVVTQIMSEAAKIQTKPLQDQDDKHMEDVTVQTLEQMSRCRALNCRNKTCCKVTMLLRVLEEALDQHWSSDIELLKTICSCLWKHATECDEPDFRCRVMWCHHLKQYLGEISDYSSRRKGSNDSVDINDIRAADDRTIDEVFATLSHIHRTPVLTCSIMPQEYPIKVFKFISVDGFEASCNIEVLTSFGHMKNVFLSVQCNSPTKQCVLKRIQKTEGDETIAEVYSCLKGHSHKHIVQHYWFAEYSHEYHLCSEFMKGGTLEECLTLNTITPQRATFYMTQILDAVTYLHKLNIVYLYWSCCNMLFTDTSRRHLKVSNLSLSVNGTEMYDVGLTKLSLPPCLVPPELTENEDVLSPLTDSWGAGCLIAEILTGKQPWYDYRHKRREEIWKKMKSGDELPLSKNQMENLLEYKELLRSCWKKNPADRISLEEIRQQLLKQTPLQTSTHTVLYSR